MIRGPALAHAAYFRLFRFPPRRDGEAGTAGDRRVRSSLWAGHVALVLDIARFASDRRDWRAWAASRAEPSPLLVGQVNRGSVVGPCRVLGHRPSSRQFELEPVSRSREGSADRPFVTF